MDEDVLLIPASFLDIIYIHYKVTLHLFKLQATLHKHNYRACQALEFNTTHLVKY